MRLDEPNVKSVTTDDGKSTLIYGFIDPHRDGGTNFRFEVDWTGRKPIVTKETRIWSGVPGGQLPVFENNLLRCRVIVDLVTPYELGEAQRAEAQRTGGWDLLKQHELREAWHAEHDNKLWFKVREFDVPQDQLTEDDVLELRDRFAKAFFLYQSSYRHNNVDPAANPDGFYADQLDFTPHFKAKSLYKTFYASWGAA